MYKLVYIYKDGCKKEFSNVSKKVCDEYLAEIRKCTPDIKWKLYNPKGELIDQALG